MRHFSRVDPVSFDKARALGAVKTPVASWLGEEFRSRETRALPCHLRLKLQVAALPAYCSTAGRPGQVSA
jgi:hypothetical protein